MKKSSTLMELIISISLLSVIILGAVSFDLASRNFLQSSERKTEVLNEIMYIIDYLQKELSEATGTIDNNAVSVSCAGVLCTVTIDKDGDGVVDPEDVTCIVNVSSGTNRMTCDGTVFSERITASSMAAAGDGYGMVINNLTLRYDPAEVVDAKTNPEVIISGIYLAPSAQPLDLP
ncbi:MAG: hypothetical protein GY858_01620 [Candidatus Omnitrophica bacterium]|nr:hypothetical protein [Candidatus Omnitrophota bacterium]